MEKWRLIKVPHWLEENNILIYTTINWKEYSEICKYDPNTITEDKLFEVYKRFATSMMITINKHKCTTKN